MIFNICCIVFFFIATIVFVVRYNRQSNLWLQLVAFNSFIAGTGALKEILPAGYSNTVNAFRIVVGLGLIIFFYFKDNSKKMIEKV